MSFNYAPIIATAQAQIKDKGRPCTLIAYNRTVQDSTKPWLGPEDSRENPDRTLALDAVFIDPTSASASAAALGLSHDMLMKLVAQSEQVVIVSPGAAEELTEFSELQDGSDTENLWRITITQILKPGDSVVLAYLGLAR